MAKATVMEARDAMGIQNRKLTFIKPLLWTGHFIYIVILTTLTASFDVGAVIPILQETEAQWGKVT